MNASNPRRNRFSPRRKALLALILLVLALVGWMAYTGVAGVSGIATKDMDWDGDGNITREEILQAFHAVVVTKTSEGQRQCSAYSWRADQRPIRVDCRTTMAAPDAKE